MDVHVSDDADAFAERVRGLVEADPFTTNVMAVMVEGIIRGERQRVEGSIWVLVTEGHEVIGAAMQTPPHNLFLPRLRAGVPEALAEALAASGRRLPGATGEIATLEAFCDTWRRATGQESVRRYATRFYVLGTLEIPPGVPGRPRAATDDDLSLVASWYEAFHAESQPDSPFDDPLEMARARIAYGRSRLWELDGEPVALAGVSAPAAGVARVGPVYTPPEHRRHGYGAAVTAAVSRLALDAGAQHVALYTDQANPTSNAIYQAIGYVAHHDSEERDFVG